MVPALDLPMLACRTCGILQPFIGGNAVQPDEVSEALQEGYERFLSDHRTHELAWFTRHGEEVWADRALWDPLATITFAASDGGRLYVVSAGRAALDEPRVYRFTPGVLELTSTTVLIDDRDLRRGLDLEFYPHALRLTKVDRFVSAVREVVSHLHAAELPVAFDDADDPAVSIAPMPDQTYAELLERCAEIFDPTELDTVSKFLRENRCEDGLLALRVRRDCRPLPP